MPDRRAAVDTVVAAQGPQPRGAGRDSNWRFIPQSPRERDRVVLPLVFTDGTRAELVYPPRLRIAAQGLTPYGSATLQGKSHHPERSDRVARDFNILYGDIDEYLGSFDPAQPPSLHARYRGVEGQSVGFWDLPHPEPNYLAYQFGRWAVLVYDYPADGDSAGAAMTEAERAAWSASFSGHETSDGFLRLEGSGPLRLARAWEHAGPQLAFGTLSGRRWFSLYAGSCKPTRDQNRLVHRRRVSWTRGFANWCLSDSMRIHARGRGPIIEALIRWLRVRNVTPAAERPPR
jgi:hypothetical protein